MKSVDELMALHAAVRTAWTSAEVETAEADLRSALEEVVRDAEKHQMLYEALWKSINGDGSGALVWCVDAAMAKEQP